MSVTERWMIEAARIFDEVVELEPDACEALIQSKCAGNPDLERAVRRLIESEVRERSANSAALAGLRSDGHGLTFGQYKSIGVLGQGGMGTVYLAERADGQFIRRAAVKVVSGEMASEAARLRFLNERQILAGLDHPNIARLLDGGVTPSGEPFLVMDYVSGQPIDRYADERKLPLRRRIRLFLKVCQAVEFAHRHLIVHRDLKPSNIFVDESGEPKLLDFGTAKILGPEQMKKTQLYLTPRYASPEQMRNEPAATGMDVYALAVVLYELLTGKWPFGDPTEMGVNIGRAMREVGPTEPSSGISEAEAAKRSMSAAQLTGALQGDLSAILRKALDPDIKRRYGTVQEFADDLLRYMGGYPVKARQHTTGYATLKWVRRNRWIAVTAAAIGVALIAGVLLREQQRAIAERRFEELRSIGRYQLFALQDQMNYHGVPIAVRRQAAERSLAALDGLFAEVGNNPGLRADLAEGYARLAAILGNPLQANLGRPVEARRALARATELVATLNGADPRLQARTEAHIWLQQAMFDYGGGSVKQPLEKAVAAAARWESLVNPKTDSPEELWRLGTLVLTLSNVARNRGGAMVQGQNAADLTRAKKWVTLALDREPNPLYRHTLLVIRDSEAIDISLKDAPKALQMMRGLLAEVDALPAPERLSKVLRYWRAQNLGSIAWQEGLLKDYDPALAHLDESAAIYRALIDTDPEQMTGYFDLAGIYRTMGFINGYAARDEAAISAFRKAVECYDTVIMKGPSPAISMLRAEVLLRMANHLVATGGSTEARAATEQGLTALVALAKKPDALEGHLLSAARYLLIAPFPELRQPKLALEFARQAAEKNRTIFTQEILVIALGTNNLWEQALKEIERLIQIAPPKNDALREKYAAERERIKAKLAEANPTQTPSQP